MAQTEFCNDLMMNEKLDVLEELGCKQSGMGNCSWMIHKLLWSLPRIYLTNQSPSTISVRWISALSSFLISNSTLISGLLYDRGWFRLFITLIADRYHLMIVGSLLQSLSLFALSFAKPGQFYMIIVLQGVLSGIGMGLTYGPSMAVISQHFSKKTYSAVARKCFRDVPFILMTAGILLSQIGYLFPAFHLQLDSIKHGIDVQFSFYALVILNASCIVGRCTAGMIPAYTGLSNLIIASTAACGILIMSMIALSNISGVVVISVAYGYFSGVCTFHVAASVISGTNDPRYRGVRPAGDYVDARPIGAGVGFFIARIVWPIMLTLLCRARMGICFAFTAFGALLSGPISGALLSSQYRWLIPSLFSGITGTHSLAWKRGELLL
ncbi:hypothetical protein BDR04DRAFT_1178472 [Suillus decipiens]|nr:hypothetical protein BDR04DRAFT_1178472 [Suillus decipiens]